MADLNVATFTGIIGRDPEYKAEANWQRLSFSMANNVGWGKNKKTQWIKVTMWGKRGEAMSRFLRAKYKVAVSGVITGRAYLDRDGKPQCSLELEAKECEIVSQASRGAAGGADSDPDGDGSAPAPTASGSSSDIDPDSVPF